MADERSTADLVRDWLDQHYRRPWLLIPEFAQDESGEALRVTAYPWGAERLPDGMPPDRLEDWRRDLDEPVLLVDDQLTAEETAWLRDAVRAITIRFPSALMMPCF
jgi:hypothetical protein